MSAINFTFGQFLVNKYEGIVPIYGQSNEGHIIVPSSLPNATTANTLTITCIPVQEGAVTNNHCISYCIFSREYLSGNRIKLFLCFQPFVLNNYSQSLDGSVQNIFLDQSHTTTSPYRQTLRDITSTYFGSFVVYGQFYENLCTSSSLGTCTFASLSQNSCFTSRTILGFEFAEAKDIVKYTTYIFVPFVSSSFVQLHRFSCYRTSGGNVVSLNDAILKRLDSICINNLSVSSLVLGDYQLCQSSPARISVQRIKENIRIWDFVSGSGSSCWDNKQISIRMFMQLAYEKIFHERNYVLYKYLTPCIIAPFSIVVCNGIRHLAYETYYVGKNGNYNLILKLTNTNVDTSTLCFASVYNPSLYSKSCCVLGGVDTIKTGQIFLTPSSCIATVKNCILAESVIDRKDVVVFDCTLQNSFSNTKFACSSSVFTEFSTQNNNSFVCFNNTIRNVCIDPQSISSVANNSGTGSNSFAYCCFCNTPTQSTITYSYSQDTCYIENYSIYSLTHCCFQTVGSEYVMAGVCVSNNQLQCVASVIYNTNHIPRPFYGGRFSETTPWSLSLKYNCFNELPYFSGINFSGTNVLAYCNQINVSNQWGMPANCCVRGIVFSGCIWLQTDVWAENVVICDNTTIFTNGFVIGGNRIFIGNNVNIRSQLICHGGVFYCSGHNWRNCSYINFYKKDFSLPPAGCYRICASDYNNAFNPSTGFKIRVMSLGLGVVCDYSRLCNLSYMAGYCIDCFSFIPTLENLTSPHICPYFTSHPTADWMFGSVLASGNLGVYLERPEPPIIIVADQICSCPNWCVWITGVPSYFCGCNLGAWLGGGTGTPVFYVSTDSNGRPIFTGLPILTTIVTHKINNLPQLQYVRHNDIPGLCVYCCSFSLGTTLGIRSANSSTSFNSLPPVCSSCLPPTLFYFVKL